MSRTRLAASVTSALLLSLCLGGATTYAQTSGGSLTAQDLVEIQQLYAHYNYAIDDGDVEAYVALYVPDGTFNAFVGHDGLRTFMKGLPAGHRRHWNTNLLITPTAEGANGSVYLLLVDVGVRPPAITAAAQYRDTLVRTPDGWRFKTRTTRGEGPPAAAPGSSQR